MMMNMDTYIIIIMMMIIMPYMIFEDLLTVERLVTDNYPDYNGSRGCEPPENSSSHMLVVCKKVLPI